MLWGGIILRHLAKDLNLIFITRMNVFPFQVHDPSCGMAGNGSRSESVSGLTMKSQLQITGKCI